MRGCLVAVGHVGVHREHPVQTRLRLSLQFDFDRNRIATGLSSEVGGASRVLRPVDLGTTARIAGLS
jgi:hypothetical protein